MDRSRKNEPVFSSLLTGVLLAQLFAIGIGLILLFIFCCIVYPMDDPDSVLLPLSLCTLYLSGLTGGIAAVRLSGDGILSGLLSGGVTMLLFRLISLLPLPVCGLSAVQVGIIFALIPFSSVCGAVIGKKRRPNKPKHRIHRR